MKTFKQFINENNRQYIDWNKNYGKTFKIVRTPEGRQSSGEWSPDLVSVVTPENGNAWTAWQEVDQNVLSNWKKNWNSIQQSLGDHKYEQIIRSQSKLNESIILELFNTLPNIGTKSNWEIIDIDDYDPDGAIQAQEVKYYVEIPIKGGQKVIYEFAASIATQKPGKELTKTEIAMLSKIHINHLPAAEVSFKTLNHPKHGDTITMVGDADVPQVINHAIAFIRDLINTFKLNLVSFSASSKKLHGDTDEHDTSDQHLYSDSREKVYERLIKRFASQMGFRYEKKNIGTVIPGSTVRASTDFILIRNST